MRLEPGEALALPPRTLHAYLAGGAIEIMGSSDNVLRGGLTPKHVDVDALLGVVDFHASPVPWVVPRAVAPGVTAYDSGVEAFRLLRVESSGAGVAVPASGPRLVLVTSGELDVRTAGGAALVRPGRAGVPRRGRGTVRGGRHGGRLGRGARDARGGLTPRLVAQWGPAAQPLTVTSHRSLVPPVAPPLNRPTSGVRRT